MYCIENNIIKTSDVSLDESHLGGVGYFCFNFMKKHGDKIAQINITTNEEETYNYLLQKCIRTSITLQKMGIKKGDVIMFCSKTNLNSCVPLIACFLIGAIPSYLDGIYPLFEIVHFVKSINPKLVLVTTDMINLVYNLIKNEHPTTDIVIYDENFFKEFENDTEFAPIYVENLEETAIIHFSSGSTGFPKGILINHYRFMTYNMLPIGIPWVQNSQKVALSYDSLHWSVESMTLVYLIGEGACRLISSDVKSDMEKTWYILEKYKVNEAFFFPLVLVDMFELGKPKNIDITNLTTLYVDGSPLQHKYHEGLQKLIPNVDIFQWYGLSEVGSLTVFQKIDLHREYNKTKPGSIGMPIPNSGVSLKVVNVETGKTVGANKRGELRVKSKSVMNGYYNLDSSDQFDENGWFKTGDVVCYDEDSCFFIFDRIKDLILYQGWHIIPALLETELLRHPAVKFATVIGIPHEKGDEYAVGLVAVYTEFGNVTPKEIEKFVEERVPDKYKLRGGVKIVNESYLTTGHKVKRYTLKQLVFSGVI